jgi:NAD-dependent DNA ligase
MITNHSKFARQVLLVGPESFDINDIIELLQFADHVYFNSPNAESFLTDEDYDVLRKYVNENSKSQYAGMIGSAVRGGKIKLPKQMGSLNQVYEGEIEQWIENSNLTSCRAIITDKLDGASVMLVYDGPTGAFKIAYSRGDGEEGADISRHVVQMRAVPKYIMPGLYDGDVFIRAENIISKQSFEVVKKLVKTSAGEEYKNARNMVSGLMNASENDPVVYDYIDCVAYEIMESPLDKMEQLRLLSDCMSFSIVYWERWHFSIIDDSMLEAYLNSRRALTYWELDGLVIEANDAGIRAALNVGNDSLNPKHAVKFKINTYIEATCTGVEWNVSKHGYLKPRVQIEPVELLGVTIQNLTGHNAKFIVEAGIGAGAVLKITRAGDVIPFIHSVVTPVEPSLPEVEYYWNETNVDIVVTDKSTNEEVIVNQMTDFFSTLEVPLLKKGNIQQLFDAGLVTIEDVIVADFGTIQHLLGVNGEMIYESLQHILNPIPAYMLMGALPYFGRGVGTRVFKKIQSVHGTEWLTKLQPSDISIEMLAQVPGVDRKTADKIVNGLDNFHKFLKVVTPNYVAIAPDAEVEIIDGKLNGMTFVFTGFRSDTLTHAIRENGGDVVDAFTKAVTHVVAKDPSKSSGKIKKAQQAGAKVISQGQLQSMLDN